MADLTETVRGKTVVIHFDGSKCIHSRHCVLDRPDVFVSNVDGAWIHPDSATADEVAELAHNCPSGAIRFEPLEGGAGERPPLVNVVRIRENGPLAFRAPLTVGATDAGMRATLCRCGASKHKPYCDNSHAAANFNASGEPPALESQPLLMRDGPLQITPLPNGPLQVSGSLEIVSGTGRTLLRCTETYLCRCGGSANKPYCDGSHAKLGFKSG